MKSLCNITSTSDETGFQISISEDFGWIEPVFLLISSHLVEILRLDKEPSPLTQVQHFEIVSLGGQCYGLHFFDTNTIIRGDSKELKIVKAFHDKRFLQDSIMYSLFTTSYRFSETTDYAEYGFFYTANNISYLTSFSAFAVEDYE